MITAAVCGRGGLHMAERKNTPAQNVAIRRGKGNLLLSAAAGSGKTYTLVSRIARLIIKGKATVSDMLIVTFTKAAAAEMKERISRILEEAATSLKVSDPDGAARARRAIIEIQAADISTIHSFLAKTLKPYYPQLGIPQDSHIADEQICKTLRQDIMRDVVDDFFAGNETVNDKRAVSFSELADIISQVRDTSSLDSELLWAVKMLQSAGLDSSAIVGYAEDIERAAESGGIMTGAYGDVLRSLDLSSVRHIRRCAEFYNRIFVSMPDVKSKYGAALSYIDTWSAELERMISDPDSKPGDIVGRFLSYDPPKLGPLKKDCVCPESLGFRDFKDSVKKICENIAKRAPLTPHAEENALRIASVMRAMAATLTVFFSRFDKRKRVMSILDYNDLETLALRLLTDEHGARTEAAAEIGAKYKYIFIDEYQDTNRVQDAVFRAISESSSRFMVGDIKQSIYRFRGAAPEVFTSYRLAWDNVIPEFGDDPLLTSGPLGEDGASLFMSENFRSSQPIIEFVNLVSDYILPWGNIAYDENDKLIYAKNDGVYDKNQPPVEICLIEMKKKKIGGDEDDGQTKSGAESESKSAAETEAEFTADKIASLIGKYGEDGSIIKGSDISVILRSPSTDAPAFREALARRNIPTVVKVERPLSSYPSVMLLFCLLNFVDNPLRDIYTAGALRSPVFSLGMGELIKIRETCKSSPLYLGVLDCASQGDDTTAEKCAAVRDWLVRHRTISRGMKTDKYIEFLIDDVDLYSLPGIRANGAERDAVNRFCTIAASFDSGGSASRSRSADLSAFIEYASVAVNETESAGGGEPSSGGDAVSIISIHASKGLEFPICFVSRCSKTRNRADETRTVLFDDKLGFAMHLTDESKLLRCDTLLRYVVENKIRLEAVREEMRMLYVALTRAKSQLYVTAAMTKCEEAVERAQLVADIGDEYSVMSASRYIDWILPAAVYHENENTLKINIIAPSEDDDEDNDNVIAATTDDGSDDEGEDKETSVSACSLSAEEFGTRAGFVYSFGYLGNIPAKLTVSRLDPQILDDGDRIGKGDIYSLLDVGQSAAGAGEREADADTPPSPALEMPRFMTGQSAAGAAESGSATHVFMQFVNFTSLREQGAEYEIRRLVRERFISEEASALIDLRDVKKFAASELMDKMLRSPLVKREFRFNVRMAASEFTLDQQTAQKLDSEGVKVTVQGVVDCVFRDPDSARLVLIDYKTDRIPSEIRENSAAADEYLRKRHKNQLTYYRRICSDMFGEDIPAAYVYSTTLSRCVLI